MELNVVQVLTIVGVPGIISGLVCGIFMLMINRTIAKSDADRKNQDEQKRKRDKILQQQNEAMETQNKALMAGVQAILRDRLLQGYRHYEEKGWADYDDRMNLENIYLQYHNLGANGVMDEYRDRFLKLPTNK